MISSKNTFDFKFIVTYWYYNILQYLDLTISILKHDYRYIQTWFSQTIFPPFICKVRSPGNHCIAANNVIIEVPPG